MVCKKHITNCLLENMKKANRPIKTAKRELLEETEYTGGKWIPFGEYTPNDSGMSNTCYTFIAKGVERVSDPNRTI